MIFIIGIIVGILLCGLVIILDIFRYLRTHKGLVESLEQFTESHLPKQKAVIIQPPSPAEDALEEIFKRNDEQNKETKLADIL